MSALPDPSDLKAYVNSLFTRERRERALDWAASPEGREAIAANLDSLKSIPTPVNPIGG